MTEKTDSKWEYRGCMARHHPTIDGIKHEFLSVLVVNRGLFISIFSLKYNKTKTAG